MKFAEITQGLSDIIDSYRYLPHGAPKDAKVVYTALVSAQKIDAWEKETGINVCSDIMLTEIDCQAPIWQHLERYEEMENQNEDGDLLYVTKMGFLGVAGYVVSHPVVFVRGMKKASQGWAPSQHMMEQHYARKSSEK